MIIKKIVLFCLIATISALFLILVVGLTLPETSPTAIHNPEPTPAVQPVALDKEGNVIEGAQAIQKENGTSVIVPSTGDGFENAQASNTTPSPTPSPPNQSTPPPSTPPTANPSPSPSPPSSSSCGSGGTCTAAQVATHNSQSNCWVIYNNKVYNVTSFVSQHEGGRDVFNSNTCGRDIGQYLSGTREPTSGKRYSHSSGDISIINSYYIADLAG